MYRNTAVFRRNNPAGLEGHFPLSFRFFPSLGYGEQQAGAPARNRSRLNSLGRRCQPFLGLGTARQILPCPGGGDTMHNGICPAREG